MFIVVLSIIADLVVVMVVFATTDIVTGIMGKELIISDSIFNSFVLVTLGSFGIAGLEKFAKKWKKYYYY